MHFVSDKDLRKVPPKRTTRVTSSSDMGTAARNVSAASAHSSSSSNPSSATSSAASVSASAGTLDIVEKSRIEREQRARLKETTAAAGILQRFWRGRHVSSLYWKSIAADLDKKMGDVEKLAKVLALKGVAYVPPEAICLQLLRLLLTKPTYLSKSDVGAEVSFVCALHFLQ
jgi:hypothetical protein